MDLSDLTERDKEFASAARYALARFQSVAAAEKYLAYLFAIARIEGMQAGVDMIRAGAAETAAAAMERPLSRDAEAIQ